MATGISSVATLSTFISFPVSIPLGAFSLAGASVSGVATVLTSKYQKKLAKVTKLVDIVTSAISVFETSLSKALNNGEIDERESQALQELQQVINQLTNVNCKVESETRNQLQKSLLEEINEIKTNLKNERRLMICSLFPVCYEVCYQNG